VNENNFSDLYLRQRRQLFSSDPVSEYFSTSSKSAYLATSLQVQRVRHTPPLSEFVSWHYCIFLYRLGHELYKSGDIKEATFTFLLNKALHSIELFYEVKFPEFYAGGHSVGAVFSKSTYGNFFVFCQNVTVGRYKMSYPTLESHAVMYTGSMIIGDCLVRENSVISAGVKVIGQSTPGNCIVFERKSGTLLFKPLDRLATEDYFLF
jgi:serine acetyltransferase